MLAGRVLWTAADRFEFEVWTPLGTCTTRAFLFAVCDAEGEPVDVAAWAPGLNRLGTWLGRAWALGQGLTLAPRLTEGLPVHRSPLSWLQAKRRGLVILNHDLARHHLDAAGPLIAEDLEHGRRLRDALTRPAPRIILPAAQNSRKAA